MSLLNPKEPLPLNPEDAQVILKELEVFRKTKLFEYIAEQTRFELDNNLRALLDHEPRTQADYREREALLGESRLLDNLIYKISGQVEDNMKAILQPEEPNTNQNEVE